MNEADRKLFDRVFQELGETRTEVASLVEKLDGLLQLRAANGLLAKTNIKTLQDRCDERHGAVVDRVEDLEEGDRASFGFRQKILGMAVVIVLLANIALSVVGFVY